MAGFAPSVKSLSRRRAIPSPASNGTPSGRAGSVGIVPGSNSGVGMWVGAGSRSALVGGGWLFQVRLNGVKTV